MSITENVARIRAEIAKAAIAAGRDPSEIRLCAATKMNDASAVREAIAAGVDCCGENRVQELVQKSSENAYDGAPVHFIGHLQTNKVKDIIDKVSLIHSVDSYRLADEISKQSMKRGKTTDVLLEINIGNEESKSGFCYDEAAAAVEKIAGLDGVRVVGLMAIPPICETPEQNRPYFAKMKKLFIDIGVKKIDNSSMNVLSMGMSDDYEVAIEEGATMVRLGTALFGRRKYNI